MERNQKQVSDSGILIIMVVLANAIVLEKSLVYGNRFYWLLLITVPLLMLSLVRRRWRA
jgi:hypothetical protein